MSLLDLGRLSKKEGDAVREFLAQLAGRCGDQIHQVVLYGSKARGDSHVDSDIDLLVLLKRNGEPTRQEILRLAARVSLNHDVLLSILVMTQDHWRTHEGLTLYGNIQKEGQAIAG